MKRGFFTILGAQFFSALADNALFIAALALLKAEHAPDWHQSMLLWCFTLSYVLLAPFVGAFADSMPKGKAMMICNGIKLLGCVGLLMGMAPLAAYAIVGFGAAAYSPAKYGIVTEFLPHDKLVAANGWLEGATVSAIIFGTVLGGFLVGPTVARLLASSSLGITGPACAIGVITLVYLIAGIINFYVPLTNVDHKVPHKNPLYLLHDFLHCVKLLWRDPQGQLSLAVTTLFWGAGATMRLVVLNWSILYLALNMEQATRLVALVAFGIAFGAYLAGQFVALRQSFRVLPAGILMGMVIISMLWVTSPVVAGMLMLLVGALGGFFVVPLNAMLQHRGHLLMGAGHSIAVQNFNENLGILVMVGLHGLLIRFLSHPIASDANLAARAYFSHTGQVPPMPLIILLFGCFLAGVMLLITMLYQRRLRLGLMRI